MNFREKFERLKKLVALANNNPNDNEANLAARKVCRILAEKNFAFIQVRTEAPKATRQEPTVRSASNPVGDDWFRKYWEPTEAQHRYYSSNYSWVYWDTVTEEPPKPKKEKKDINCSKCGELRNTAFVGPPQIYVCNKCVWQTYQDSKK